MNSSASENKPAVHQSELNLFELCGEAARRRYIEGEIIPPGVAMLRGSMVHVAAQQNHYHKKACGTDLEKSKLVEIAVAAFKEKCQREGFRLTREEMQVGVLPMLARTKEAGRVLTELYRDRIAPSFQPDLIEEKIHAVIPTSPVDLEGTIDLTTTDGRLKDLKTSGRRKSQAEADGSLQLSTYGILYYAKRGVLPSGYDLHVMLDQDKPDVQTLATTRSTADFSVLAARLNVMLAAKKAGVFPPAAVGSWICSARWCGYFDSCPYVNSERKAAAEKNL